MGANPGKLVYGTILVATLLAAESARQETYAKTAAAVVIALLVYWLAASYAQFTGERLERGEPFHYGALLRTVVHEVGVIVGAFVPLAVLLVMWAAGAALTHGGDDGHLDGGRDDRRHRGADRCAGRPHRPRAGAPDRVRGRARPARGGAAGAAALTRAP